MHLLSFYLFILLLLTISLLDYQSLYYSALETVGVNKRELIVTEVTAASKAQLEAGEEFNSAFDAFKAITQFDSKDLEQIYKKIENQCQNSQKSIENVRKRIVKIEKISAVLFAEWDEELLTFSSPSLRLESEAKLNKTKQNYAQMLSLMKIAENKMTPVLLALKDTTLLLKHNLNAIAIDSLQHQFNHISLDIEFAIKEMNKAISQSNQHISLECLNCINLIQNEEKIPERFIGNIY